MSPLLFLLCLVGCSGYLGDDMQPMEAACLEEGAFHCASDGCVSGDSYCDNKYDCADGSDENFCPNHPPDVQFCNETHQYLCVDGSRCILSVWLCDNEPNCPDGSDELNCNFQEPLENSTCKGFSCDEDRCISYLWTCDGKYDCHDHSDEDIEHTCRHALRPHTAINGVGCREFPPLEPRRYTCNDSSFCLEEHHMCDGMQDCRDGSDEGAFCEHWHTMCSNFTCHGNTTCTPERTGPSCICLDSYNLQHYNYSSGQCEDINDCLQERPQCSHQCENKDGYFLCHCDPGYIRDNIGYLCYAPDPEAMLFFSTQNDIRYLKIKSKQQVVLATGIKQAHGVSYDGKYLYWVETAQGHQAIVRAQLDNIHESKEVLVGLGLEEPGDIAVDYLAGNIYFGDAVRGAIFACRSDGSICTTINTDARHPRFVTLDVGNGLMYWADWHSRAVIMRARMDGSHPEVLVDGLRDFATGLALDIPNDRLYYVDRTIRVVKIDDKKVYSLFEEPFHQPYAIAVFENTVFWSDWTSTTVQTSDKLHAASEKRNVLMHTDMPVFDMHIYHPVVMNISNNPCGHSYCSHLCLITSNVTYICACPDGMEAIADHCHSRADYRPQYLIVGGESSFTRIQLDTLGNPESHGTHFDIGRVQAMAYDSSRDVLYIYDGRHKSISYVNMSEFSLGLTHPFLSVGLDNVVDMDYDYVTDSLYILDAGRGFVEVVSLKTKKRALVYRFQDQEVPVSFCVVPDYGRMLVALVEREQNNEMHVDSIGLDGSLRVHLLMNNIIGPVVRLRYSPHMGIVYLSDDGNGIIDYMHPGGTGRENFRELTTTVGSLSVTENVVFWSDRRTLRLYWADVHEATHRIRRLELSIFPNTSQLHLQATQHPHIPTPHPCSQSPCAENCVQTPHTPHQKLQELEYKCLCTPGLLIIGGKCTRVASCGEHQLYCHRSNDCFDKGKKCNGKWDCVYGEDEEGCATPQPSSSNCSINQVPCNGGCIKKDDICKPPGTSSCDTDQFECVGSGLCIERSLACDGHSDCPDASDEEPRACDTRDCFQTEFMCATGSCIPATWRCDRSDDCTDGSDEVDCENKTCTAGYFECNNGECVEVRKRCDGTTDCADHSDEERCDQPEVLEFRDALPACHPWEYACENNKSICLPQTARCNTKVDCPGSTDELGCDFRCEPRGMFACAQETTCVPRARVCDGHHNCLDGSDETPDACNRVNRTSIRYPTSSHPAECLHGYQCQNGECVEWSEVCDGTHNCHDGSDEGGLCATVCALHACPHECRATPRGPLCVCRAGYTRVGDTCVDIDECAMDVCSQTCDNIPGSFFCSCYRGYGRRSDRRSCKAVSGEMSVLHVSGNSVKSMFADYKLAVEYNDPSVASVSDLDYNDRTDQLYIVSEKSGKLIEVNRTHGDPEVTVITNIGRPTKVAVEWVTGNVYFADSTAGASCLRVCDVRRRRCARLQKLPTRAQVTALVVEPVARKLFYCVSWGLESMVRASSLSGRAPADLAALPACTGLALDSHRRRLYVASTGPSQILLMDYEGKNIKTYLSNNPNLQAPHGLAIFEDSIYFLEANSFKLSRCLLYGPKTCEPYLYMLFDANTFALRHSAAQRSDIRDLCAGHACHDVCVLADHGPQCVCQDGSLTDGNCPSAKQNELALFNGWSQADVVRAHQTSYTLVAVVVLLLLLYAAVLVYYHLVKRNKEKRIADYMQVRYQNTSEGLTELSYPVIEVPTAGGIAHEFVNPLQFVRNMWQQSFYRRTKPVDATGFVFDTQQDLSDTESDLDVRENKRMLRNFRK